MGDKRTELPTDFAEQAASMSSLNQPPETLEEWWTAVAEQIEESDLTVVPSDFYSDQPTRHEVRFNDRKRYAHCALDALAAAVMEEPETATVRSIDPVSTAPITVAMEDDAITVSPDSALICFGFDLAPGDLEEAGSVAEWALQAEQGKVQSGICQYTNAFENHDTYEQWAAETDSVSLPLPPGNVVRLLQELQVDRD